VISSLGADLFPEEQVNKIEVLLQFPQSRIAEKNEIQLTKLESLLAKISDVESYVIQNQSANSSRFTLTVLSKPGKIEPATKTVLSALSSIPDLRYNRQKQSVFGTGKPIQIIFEGDNLKLTKGKY